MSREEVEKGIIMPKEETTWEDVFFFFLSAINLGILKSSVTLGYVRIRTKLVLKMQIGMRIISLKTFGMVLIMVRFL